MKKVRTLLAVAWVVLFPLVVFSETNEVLDVLYTSEKAPMLESVWLILSGNEIISETSPLSEAEKWISQSSRPDYLDSPFLTQGQLALVIAESSDLPMGLMYRLTGSPRYAVKDLLYLNILNGTFNPAREVTAFELINALGIVLQGADS